MSRSTLPCVPHMIPLLTKGRLCHAAGRNDRCSCAGARLGSRIHCAVHQHLLSFSLSSQHALSTHPHPQTNRTSRGFSRTHVIRPGVRGRASRSTRRLHTMERPVSATDESPAILSRRCPPSRTYRPCARLARTPTPEFLLLGFSPSHDSVVTCGLGQPDSSPASTSCRPHPPPCLTSRRTQLGGGQPHSQ